MSGWTLGFLCYARRPNAAQSLLVLLGQAELLAIKQQTDSACLLCHASLVQILLTQDCWGKRTGGLLAST